MVNNQKSIKVPKWLLNRIHKSYEVFLNIHGEYYDEEREDSEIDADYFNEWVVVYHFNYDDDDYEKKLYMELIYKPTLTIVKTFDLLIPDQDPCSLSTFIELFSLKDEYLICNICSIYKVKLYNGICSCCYMHSYDNPEPCFMCEETFGSWGKYECGHILHKACVDKIKDKKCPLCRNQLKHLEMYYGEP